MPTVTAKPRRRATRQRRHSSSAPSPARGVAQLLAAQDDALRTKRYEVLGRVMVMETDGGQVDFGKEGFMLGRMRDRDQLLALTPWPGMPEKVRLTDQLCPDCRAECDECDAGRRICTICGGTGINKIARRSCPKCVEKRGAYNPRCRECAGSGTVSANAPCAGCKGTKGHDCGLCLGTGRRSTGLEGGAIDHKSAPACKCCGGQRRVAERTPQEVSPHIRGRLDDRLVLGPVTKMVLKSADVNATSFLVIRTLPDENENWPVLVLDGLEAGANAHFLGGRTK